MSLQGSIPEGANLANERFAFVSSMFADLRCKRGRPPGDGLM